MTFTKERIIEDLKASMQNSSGMFEISEDTICALMSLLTAPPAPVSVPEILPCPVLLEPGMRFGKGVRTQTMLDALQRRANYYAEMEAMTPEQRAEHDEGMKEFAALLQGKAEPVSQREELTDGFDFDRFNDVVWLEAVASNPHMHSLTTSTIAMVALELNRKLAAGNSPVIPDDVRRMDWLVSKTVDVREPMVYGSHSLFWSQTITDEEDDYHATKLREQIDAAMAADNAAAPQQEVNSGR